MINLDDRIIDKSLLDESELWLLLHIVKRINRNRKSFPGNDLLCQDTGYSIGKLKKVKKSLVTKGMLLVKGRLAAGNKFTSNEYTVNTGYVSIFLPMKEVKTSPVVEPLSKPVIKPIEPKTVVQNLYHGEGETVVQNLYHGECETVVQNLYHEVLSSTTEVLMCMCGSEENEAGTHTLKKQNECPSGQNPPPSSAAPPPRELSGPTLFRETKYVQLENGLEIFKQEMISRNEAHDLVDLEFYYQKVLNWSDNGNRRKNWLASASMFILNDKKDNKIQLKHADTKSTINGHPVAKVADYYTRISGNNRTGM